MIVTAPKKPLLVLLQSVADAADKRATLPALACIQLRADGDTLSAAATDLRVSASCSMAANVRTAGGALVDRSVIIDRVKSMPDGADVRIEAEPASVTISSGKRRCKVAATPLSEAPSVAAPSTSFVSFEVEPGALQSLIARTSFAISDDWTRPHVNSALLEIADGTATMAATDGHRVAVASTAFDPSARLTALVSQSSINAIERFCERHDEKVSLGLDGVTLFLLAGSDTIGAKQVDGTFPPYKQVMPKSAPRNVRVPTKALLDAVGAVESAASQKHALRLTVTDGVINLFAQSPENGEASDEVGCDYTGKKLVIGHNAAYLAQALKATGADEVVLGIDGELDPMLLTVPDDDSTTMCLMPMRL